jgi:glycosyltransferase involved in cell wall biosynthesis
VQIRSDSKHVVAAYLETCDALVLPSRDDLIPPAAIEAMAKGACVVSSANGEVPEVNRYSHNGLLPHTGHRRF